MVTTPKQTEKFPKNTQLGQGVLSEEGLTSSLGEFIPRIVDSLKRPVLSFSQKAGMEEAAERRKRP